MTTRQTSAVALRLNEQELNELLGVLERSLEEGRVEKRRTEAFQAREQVKNQQKLLQGLVDKVSAAQVELGLVPG